MTRAAKQIKRRRIEQKDNTALKFIQEFSPTLNAVKRYAEDKAYDSLKGLFGEDESLKEDTSR
ncbi:hypothetical protein AGMMS49531_00810 [Endomicrobiia bacterium]|nr:hypothetical protein AGMMS49531_00810 [Endomicrobiia bacterium]